MPPPNLAELLELARFPGRFEPEHEVIRDWLKARGHLYDRIEFNVRLGNGAEPPPDLVEPFRSLAIQQTQLRADILAWRGPFITIIEAKGRAGLDALGQLQGYRVLTELSFRDFAVDALEVICRRVNNDVLTALVDNGVTVRVYELEEAAPAPGEPVGGSS